MSASTATTPNAAALAGSPATLLAEADAVAARCCNGHAVTLPTPVAWSDWDDLFDAVKARLHASVRDLAQGVPPPHAPELLAGQVLECVTALEHLHAALRTARRPAHGEALLATPVAPPRTLYNDRNLLPRGDFDAGLAIALRTATPWPVGVAMLCLELDGLASVDGRYGREVGDALVGVVAARLSRALRGDDMVTHLGRGAFACVVLGTTGHDALSRLACKLFEVVSALMQIGPHELAVEASIGIAEYPQDGADPDALRAKADAALHRARRRRSGYAFAEHGPAPA